jgi:hypothetical protein
MTKKTASKSTSTPAARTPAARAPRASAGASGGPGRPGGGASRGGTPAGAKSGPQRTSASTKKASPKKPAARAATPAKTPAAPTKAPAPMPAKTPPAAAKAAPPAPPKASGPVPARPITPELHAVAADAVHAESARTEETPRGHGAGDVAERILEAGDTASVLTHAEHLTSDKPTTATAAARVLDEVLARKPEMLVPTIDKLVHVVTSGPKRSVQTAAAALPVMARLAPARVARHLPALTERFGQASELGKDGLVATFAALCTASVAYQKRLEPVLELALSTADPKTLQRWTEVVLPSLKGEPHARARAVVEDRLNHIPRPQAQPIASFLGIKLRPAAR